MSETRGFRAHQNLLMSVIRDQAGTFDKAVLEAVTNSIEAGATRIDLSLTESGGTFYFTAADNGRGFQSEEEIQSFFEVFGLPHGADENIIWKRFRMGRGQMFAFGRNVWRTNSFKMEVDIQECGLTYELDTGLKPVSGCQIDVTLYKPPIGPGTYYGTFDEFRDRISEQIEFVSCDVFISGKKVNSDPATCKWTLEDENAYYLFDDVGTDLRIFNMGVFVERHALAQHGLSGIIVSKKPLKVIFARNQIHQDCPVLAEIMKVVRAQRGRTLVAGRRLSDEERISCLRDVLRGVMQYSRIRTLKLLRNTSGRHMSFSELVRSRLPWSIASPGDSKADRLMQRGTAIILDRKIFTRLRVEPGALFATIRERQGFSQSKFFDEMSSTGNRYREFSELVDGLNANADNISRSDWTTYERSIVSWLNRLRYTLKTEREFLVGTSDTYDAWTDGYSYVALGREFLRRLFSIHKQNGSRIAAEIAHVVFHELSHDSASFETHLHGEEFYRAFHDNTGAYHLEAVEMLAFEMTRLLTDERAEKRRLAAERKLEKQEKIKSHRAAMLAGRSSA